jgi:hypothetical protein
MADRRFSRSELALLAIALLCYGGQTLGSISDLFAGTGASGVPFVTVKTDGRVYVSGFREGGEELGGLKVGDQIVQVGERQDLPQSQIAWRHDVVHADGKVRVRRDGKVLQVDYSVNYFGFPAAVLLKDLFYGVVAIGLLFAPGGLVRTVTAAAALFWISIGEGAPIGPTATATLWLAIANWISQAMLWPLLINFAQLIQNPQVSPVRLVPAWTFASAGLALMFVYTGGPLAPSQHFAIYLALPMLATAVSAGLLIRNFWRSTGKLRRQYNWIATSIFVNGIAVSALFVISVVLVDYQIYLLGVEFTSLIVVAGITMAVLRADFAGLDRAATLSATLAVIAVGFALVFEFALEPLAGLTTRTFGLSESIGQTLLIVVAALAAPSLKRRIQPWMERVLSEGGEPSHPGS